MIVMSKKMNGETSPHGGATPQTNNFSDKDTKFFADMQTPAQLASGDMDNAFGFIQESRTKDNLPQLTAEEVKPTIFIAPEAAGQYTALLESLLINPDKPEPEPEPLLTLHDTPILWRGCKSFVCSVAKGRKTTTLTLLAAILCGRDETANGFYAKAECKVLFIDTEQARTDSQRILHRVAKLCNKKANALPLHVLSLNRQSPENIRSIMEAAVIRFSPSVLILDNWTDCVASVMDDKECTEFSRKLRELAEVYNIAIFSVIHANESARNDDKPNFRGWGAEEARKSDLTLFLKDMGDYSRATFGRCRGKRPERFAVSIDTNGLPYFYTEAELPKPVNPDKYASIVAKIPTHGLLFNELQKLIKDTANKAESTARDWVCKMERKGVVKKIGGRYYRPENAPTEPEEELPF